MRLVLIFCLALAGCAGIFTRSGPSGVQVDSRGAVTRFNLEGRVAVKSGDQNFSGGMRWERREDEEVVLLSTPLGQGVAEIRRDERGVVLVDAEGKRYQAADIDTLAQGALGVPIPLSGLVYWLSARPRPLAPHVAYLDKAKRVAILEQDGWRIEYDRYQRRSGVDLPAKVFARRDGEVEFRLVVDAWETP